RFFASSKTCHVCLNRVDSLSLDIRQWQCQHCGTCHDRDVNAAQNIRNEALRILRLCSVQVLRLCSVQVLSLVTSDTAWVGSVRQPGKTSVLLDAVPVESGSPIL
ncbi:zinc ribbon domain-containing protein, partial [Arthrospira platensis]